MLKTVKAKAKKKNESQRDYVAHSVQRLYNKSAPMLVVESILFLIAGVIMLVNPVGVLSAITFVLGCVLMLLGFYRMVSGFIVSHDYGGGWIDVLAGLLNIIIGLLFLTYPLGSVISLVYVFIVLFIFKALAAFIFAINMVRARFGHYIFNLIMSIILVCVSVALLFYPLAGAVAVVLCMAAMLLAYAIADMYMYWQLRSLKKNVVG